MEDLLLGIDKMAAKTVTVQTGDSSMEKPKS
jgi:hypothetical protein